MQLSLNLDTNDDTPKNLLLNRKPEILNKLPDTCVIVDIETTGLSAIYDNIIEISALKIKNNEVQKEFSSLVKPEKYISSFVSNLTGITQEMTKNAPTIKAVLEKFCNFVEDTPIVGHNIKFDLSFLNKNLKDVYKNTLKNDYADTLAYSKKVYKNFPSYKLTYIANSLNIDTNGAHRALKDCYMTYAIMQDMKKKDIKE